MVALPVATRVVTAQGHYHVQDDGHPARQSHDTFEVLST